MRERNSMILKVIIKKDERRNDDKQHMKTKTRTDAYEGRKELDERDESHDLESDY